jgi:serine/threonine protein kinase
MPTIPRNPYVAGAPVGNSPAFVGRSSVLCKALRVLDDSRDRAILLYGQRRIGKTSILQHLEAQLRTEGSYCPVLFDLMDKSEWPLGRILQELADTIADSLGQAPPDLGHDPEGVFCSEWFPSTLTNLPKGRSLVLLLDEFDVLAVPGVGQAEGSFFSFLRGLLTSGLQRLQLVFVIGRNVGDMATIALSLFKDIPNRRVSLLSEEDTAKLVRLSEGEGTLLWSDETVKCVWQLTGGHPFLTQQLCFEVWMRIYDEEPGGLPFATPADVEAAVQDASDAISNTMESLWDDLGPAERLLTSVLAQAGSGPTSQEELESLVEDSDVRIRIRELEQVPQRLQDLDVIEETEYGYRFRVELLRSWITKQKPLNRVREGLESTESRAENWYRVGWHLYQSGDYESANSVLQRAIDLDPDHLLAHETLADVIVAQEKPDLARVLLERLYPRWPAAFGRRLADVLMFLAQEAAGEEEKLALYKQVLEVDPHNSEAEDRATAIEVALRRQLKPTDAILSGKYRILRLIGEGDLVSALLAEKPKVGDRQTSIREFMLDGENGPVLKHRFHQVLKVASQLEQSRVPHVQRVYAIEEPADDALLLVMEHVEGGSLEDLLTRHTGNLPIEQALMITQDVLQALAGVHHLSDNLVHGGIKPSTILLDRERGAILSGFCLAWPIAKSGQPESSPTTTEGTPSDQERDISQRTQATDLYDLGCVLFEMLTGEQYEHGAPCTKANEIRPEVPEWLDEILVKALAEDPLDRYPTAEEMAVAIDNGLCYDSAMERRRNGDFLGAIEQLRKIPPTAKQFVKAQSTLAETYEDLGNQHFLKLRFIQAIKYWHESRGVLERIKGLH